jgi:hypothetical protein
MNNIQFPHEIGENVRSLVEPATGFYFLCSNVNIYKCRFLDLHGINSVKSFTVSLLFFFISLFPISSYQQQQQQQEATRLRTY